MHRGRTLGPLLAKNGYVHRGDLLDAGWRPDAIRDAVRAEGLIRAGRSWILLPNAPRELHAAAASGGVVTCVSASAMRKLWRPGHDETPHICLRPSARRAPDGVRAHWTPGVVPRSPRSLIDSIENVLAIVAICQPHDAALAVWNSALRHGAVTPERLALIDWRGDRARRLRDEACALSHSGIETLFVAGMRRAGVIVRQQVKIAGHHVDALIGTRLVVQIDGFAHHVDAKQRRSDIAHDRALQRLGFTVLRFDYHEIVNEWPRVEAEVLAALRLVR